jgi:beta-aspartyl-peptidase (threonine type)
VPGVKRLFVHGGVSGTPKQVPDLTACARSGLVEATALDAVQSAIVALEDHPELNAGFGATLTRDGTIELDAALADGRTGRHAGVMAVQVRNPILLARRVLDHTPHVLMTGDGAMRLGRDLPLLGRTTDDQHARFEIARADGRLGTEAYADPDLVDTVGAVALASDGSLAAGSSTGGVFGKLPGRVGDSAVPGAGTYACAAAAVVGTGVGEAFLHTLACYRVAALIEEGLAPQEACERVVRLIGERYDVAAGLLALGPTGEVGAAFRGGSWSVASADGPVEAARVV